MKNMTNRKKLGDMITGGDYLALSGLLDPPVNKMILKDNIIADVSLTDDGGVMVIMDNGFVGLFLHQPRCCENCNVIDIEGRIEDLIGATILDTDIIPEDADNCCDIDPTGFYSDYRRLVIATNKTKVVFTIGMEQECDFAFDIRLYTHDCGKLEAVPIKLRTPDPTH